MVDARAKNPTRRPTLATHPHPLLRSQNPAPKSRPAFQSEETP
jgi:hypothetical protein